MNDVQHGFKYWCVITALSLLCLPVRTYGNGQEQEDETPVQVIDPGAAPTAKHVLAPYLTFGGRLELEHALEKNFDFNNNAADNLSLLTPEVSMAISFEPAKIFQTFLNVSLSKETILNGDAEKKKSDFEVKQAYMAFRNQPGNLSFQLGRQRFKDEREWLFDEEMYALRILFQQTSRLLFDASVSREEIADRIILDEKSKEKILNYTLYTTYAFSPNLTMAAYGLIQKDEIPGKHGPWFLGIHTEGRFYKDVKHWLELARVKGKENNKIISGKGFDFGATWRLRLPSRPSLTIGYASGSGDFNSNDNTDTNFRQTDLQDNSGKFGGVTRFKYYGELFDPELSNMTILTGGASLRPTRRSSLEFVYHTYTQEAAAKKIRDSAIDLKPTGKSKNLGREIDLVAGFREIKDIDIKLLMGLFTPGSAFPAGSSKATFVNFEIRYSF